jgi:hypothetical protein
VCQQILIFGLFLLFVSVQRRVNGVWNRKQFSSIITTINPHPPFPHLRVNILEEADAFSYRLFGSNPPPPPSSMTHWQNGLYLSLNLSTLCVRGIRLPMSTLAGGRVRGGGAEPNKTTAKNAGLFQYNPSTTSTNYFIRDFYQKSGRNYTGFTEQMQNLYLY